MNNKIKNLQNQRFGKLQALCCVGKNKYNQMIWKCQCDCGSTITTTATNLLKGRKKSCGCLTKELNKTRRITHSLSRHPLYKRYHTMLCRVIHPCTEYMKENYKDRGITICDEWLGKDGFINFYNWAIANGWNNERLPSGRPMLTLDRIDNSKGYSPENCRWVDMKTQNNNRRKARKNVDVKYKQSLILHYTSEVESNDYKRKTRIIN